MRKIQIVVLYLLSLNVLSALPIGNPSDPVLFSDKSACCIPQEHDPCFNWCEAFSLRLGFYGDYVYNRHMAVDTSSDNSDISDTMLFTNAGSLVLNVYDKLDIFATLGASHISLTADGGAFSNNTTMVELDFQTAWSWSIGARASLCRCGCFNWGIEGQYFNTNPNLNNMIRYATGSERYFNTHDGSNYSEWQIGTAVSYIIQTSCPGLAFVPYIGVKWAHSNLDLGDVTFTQDAVVYTLKNLESDKLWGYAVGLSAVLLDSVGIGVEGRFADEKALYANMQVRY